MATTELVAFTISSSFCRTALASVQAPNVFLSFWFALFGETRSCYIILYDLELVAILAAPPKAHSTDRCEPPGI